MFWSLYGAQFDEETDIASWRGNVEFVNLGMFSTVRGRV